MTGISMCGEMAVGIVTPAEVPSNRIRIATTTNVYGRCRATLTIHIGLHHQYRSCCRLHFPPQCPHVDYEAIFHVAFEHACVGLLNVLHGDHLDIGHDAPLRAEIQHLLRLGDATDQGTRDRLAAEDHVEDGRRG